MLTRITPEKMFVPGPEDVFVFGSNEAGHHFGGAARFAMTYCGANFGVPFGLSRHSFAIPTMDKQLQPLSLDKIEAYIEAFDAFTEACDEYNYYVSAIGCGIAGYKAEKIAPMFAWTLFLPNIALPLSFWQELQKIGVLDEANAEEREAFNIPDLSA